MAKEWFLTPLYPTPVEHWLGLGHTPPEGLHGDKRRGIVKRHASTVGGFSVHDALVKTYTMPREVAIVRLLRQRRLDDALWRNIYALMVIATPVNIFALIKFLTNLTSEDRQVAEGEAEKYMQWWYRAHAGSSDDE